MSVWIWSFSSSTEINIMYTNRIHRFSKFQIVPQLWVVIKRRVYRQCDDEDWKQGRDEGGEIRLKPP